MPRAGSRSPTCGAGCSCSRSSLLSSTSCSWRSSGASSSGTADGGPRSSPREVKTIAVEEHCWTRALRDALVRDGSDESVGYSASGEVGDRMLDLAGERLRHMDDAGVDLQVISVGSPGTQPLAAAEAVPIAREANDAIAAAVAAH